MCSEAVFFQVVLSTKELPAAKAHPERACLEIVLQAGLLRSQSQHQACTPVLGGVAGLLRAL